MAVTQARPARGSPSKAAAKGLTLDLPMVTMQLHAPDVHLPHLTAPHLAMPHISRQEMGHAVDVARSFLPAPERIAYYGALSALAAFGVLEWPVAAAIGVGTMVAARAGAEEQFNPLHKLQEVLPSAQAEQRSTAATPSKEAPASTTPSKRAATSTRRTAAATKGTAASTKGTSAATKRTSVSTKGTSASTRKKSTATTTRQKSTAGRTRSSG